jgi:hypothetical protein
MNTGGKLPSDRGRYFEVRGPDRIPRNGRDDISTDDLFLTADLSEAHVYQWLPKHSENTWVQNGNTTQ